MAKRTISLLNIKILADATGVTKGTNKAKGALGRFGKEGGKGVDGLSAKMTKLAGVVAGVAAGLAIAAKVIQTIVRNTLQVADALEKTAIQAQTLGIAVNQLTALRSEAERAGSSAATLDTALQRLVRRVSEAAQGTGEAVGALQELGLEARELARLDAGAQFAAIAVALGGVANQGDRVRLMMKLVDTEGVALDSTFRRIAEGGMQAAVDRAREFSLVLSGIDESNLQGTVEASNDLKDAWQGVKNQIAAAFAPAVTRLIEEAAVAMLFLLDTIKAVRVFFFEWGGTSAEASRAIVDATDKAAVSIEMALGGIPDLADTAAEHLRKMGEVAEESFDSTRMLATLARLRERLEAIVEPVLNIAAGPVGALDINSQAGLSAIAASKRENRRAELELRKMERERAKRDAKRDDILQEIFHILVTGSTRPPVTVTRTAIVG